MVIILNGMLKTESEKLFKDKVRKNFFKDENERNLWVRLNAEHIKYFHKVVNRIEKDNMGDVNKPYSHMWVSNNQLTYDEYMCDAPRYSFEELVLPHDELLRLADKRNRAHIKKIFGDIEGIVKLGEIEDEDL